MDSKPFFRKLFRPMANRFAAAGISANQVTTANVTIAAMVGATVLLYGIERWPLLLIPAALTVRLAFNHIDGLLAVEHGFKTHLGALLNEMADVIADTVLYAPVANLPGVNGTLVLAVVFLGLLSETAGLAALRIGVSRREDGPMTKKVRGLVFSGVAITLGLGVHPGMWLDLTMAATLVMVLVTIVRRITNALAQAAEPC